VCTFNFQIGSVNNVLYIMYYVLYMIDSKANIILLDNNMTIVLYCIWLSKDNIKSKVNTKNRKWASLFCQIFYMFYESDEVWNREIKYSRKNTFWSSSKRIKVRKCITLQKWNLSISSCESHPFCFYPLFLLPVTWL